MNSIRSSIVEKIENRERLSEEDALYLFQEADLLELGRLADRRNSLQNNDVVYFNVNRHINPTNICTQSCRFCAYAKKPGQPGAYEYTIDEILTKADEVVRQGATEVHMVGGLHPRWRFGHYVDIVSALKNKFPDLHIKAFTAVELDWMAKRDRRPVEAILRDLVDAGLGSLPGGGAEIFHEDVRKQICAKSTADRWLEIHRMAHEMGLHSNCTMLYGHVETYAHRVDHMRRLRDLQDVTRGFNAFIPLSFQPEDNNMGITRYTLGYEDLKTIAVARLFLDNFKHIKAYWIMLGQDIAQIALNFGANDLDGTVTEEKISRAAGGRSGIVLSKKEIRKLIQAAGKIPCERDTLYNPIEKVVPKAEKGSYDLVLYKAEKGATLSREESDILLSHADIFELASLKPRTAMKFPLYRHFIYGETIDEDASASQYAMNMLKKIEVLRTGLEHPLILSFELREIFANWTTPPSFHFLTEVIKKIRAAMPELKIGVRGIKYLWKMSRSLPGGFHETLDQLRDAGVTHCGSSILEHEHDLTENEYAESAKAILARGFHATFKAQISAAVGQGYDVFWENFTLRLQTIRSLIDELGVYPTLLIDSDKDCPVTPVEFLKALSIANFICGDHCQMEVQLRGLPIYTPAAKRKQATEESPAMKYAPLVYYFGAKHLGGIDLENCDNEILFSELTRSGITFAAESPKREDRRNVECLLS